MGVGPETINGTESKTAAPAKKAKTVFKPDALPKIFDAQKWVGNTQGMQELWEKVPAHMKKKFNFAAALAQTRRENMKRFPAVKPVIKNTPPSSPPSPPTIPPA